MTTDRSKYEPIGEDSPRTPFKKKWMTIGLIVLVAVAAGAYHVWYPSPRTSSSGDSSMDVVSKLLHDLNGVLTGTVIFPYDHDDPLQHSFEEASKVWNQCALPPLAVIQVANEKDVSLAIPVLDQLSQEHNVPFRIKSGGHSYTGWSSVDSGIILSLSELNQIVVDEITGVATLGPAATDGKILDVALPLGYGGVVGFCPGVAVGGFALAGGLGLQSRLYGLGLDNIVAARVVLHDGSVVKASAEDDQDLFFALRGAGPNSFGVVTELKYQLHPLAKGTILGQELLSIEGMVPIEDVARVGVALGNMEQDLPNNWFPIFEGNLDPDGSRSFPFMILYTGKDISEAKSYATDTLLPSLVSESTAADFEMDTLSWHNWTIANGNLEGNYVRSWTGFLYPQDNNDKIWSKIMVVIVEACDLTPYIMTDIELWGGAISTKAKKHETAFPFRDALWNVGLLLMVPVEEGKDVFDDLVVKIDNIWPKAAKYLDGVYYNYQMESLAEEEYPYQYWGDNVERLSTLKKVYDPNNTFNFPQSVPLPKET